MPQNPLPRWPLPCWALALLVFPGCTEGLGAEMPTAERRVLDAASARRKDSLDARIADCRERIAEAEAELGDLERELQVLSPSEYLGSSARRWRERSAFLRVRIQDLRERLNAALDEVAALSG